MRAGPDKAILVDVIIYRGEKLCCVHIFTGHGAISQKPNDVCNKTLHLALEDVENCQSGLSFIAFGCLNGQNLVQKFIKFDHACITACTR